MSNRQAWDGGVCVFELLEERVLLSASDQAIQLFNSSPALFVQNQGQWSDASVRYAFQRQGAAVAFTDAGPVYHLYASADGSAPANGRAADHGRARPSPVQETTFSTSFVGALAVTPVGLDLQAPTYNYFIGDSSTWAQNVPTFSTVAYRELYDGIDLYLSGGPSDLKYEFHVAPGADAGSIAVRYNGVDSLSLNAAGDLVVATAGGTMTDSAPVIYQVINGQRVAVAGAFTLLDDHTFGFSVTGAYDRSAELVIDPLVVWSTYLGGTDEDTGYGVDIDPTSGNIVTTGWTYSTDFTGRGNNLAGSYDGFVAKLTPVGGLLWATYVGGSDSDQSQGIGVDTLGNIFIGGDTFSSDLALANNTINLGTGSGADDAFVAKLNSGGGLLWSTYVGGSDYDNGDGLTVDVYGNALLQAETFCNDVPLSVNASPGGGSEDGLVAKVNTNGQLIWTSYLGGSDEEDEYGIYTDSLGDSLVTGFTASLDFVGMSNAPHGGLDAYVAKLDFNGVQQWAVCLGGADDDVGNMITADAFGNVIITGYTYSTTFGGVVNTNSSHGGSDAFAAKLSAAGAVQWVTFVGGSGDDSAEGIGADLAGNTLVAGNTDSTDMVGAQNVAPGGGDVFVAKVSPAGLVVGLVYVGGTDWDTMWGDTVNSAGQAIISGSTWSTDFASATNFNRGGQDAFVAVVNFNIAPTVTTTPTTLSYLQCNGAAIIDPGVTPADPDSTMLSGAWVWISGNYASGQDFLGLASQNGIIASWDGAGGILTLTGAASVANYTTALRSVAFYNGSATPSLLARTISYCVNDGSSNSNTAIRSMTFTADIAPAVSTTGTTLAYLQCNGAVVVDPGVTATDSDSAALAGGWVWISGNFAAGQDVLGFTNQNGITGSWDGATGFLTLGGAATLANYVTALRSVAFNNTSASPSLLARTISFRVTDGFKTSNAATRSMTFTADAAPVVTTTGTTLAYQQAAGARVVDPGVTATDSDNATLAGGWVWISVNFAVGQDVLGFTNQNGIVGSWNASTGILTLGGTATVANYQTALESVAFNNTSTAPSVLARTISFAVNDGVRNSNTATRSMSFTADAAPVVTTTGGSMSYPSNAYWLAVDPLITVADSDSAALATAVAWISGGYQASQDVLDVTPQGGIIDTWDPSTGILTMTGPAGVAAWQLELRAVTYLNNSANPNTSARTVSFAAYDGLRLSNTATRGIAVTLANVAPSDVALTNSSVNEDLDAPATVGTLSTTDPDPKETWSYSLVAGFGDNYLFQITGSVLQTGAVLDYETMAHSYSVKVRTTDSGPGNLTFDKTFTIALNDTGELRGDHHQIAATYSAVAGWVRSIRRCHWTPTTRPWPA